MEDGGHQLGMLYNNPSLIDTVAADILTFDINNHKKGDEESSFPR